MTEEMKNCPDCGARGFIEQRGTLWTAQCRECSLSVWDTDRDTPSGALEVWQARPASEYVATFHATGGAVEIVGPSRDVICSALNSWGGSLVAIADIIKRPKTGQKPTPVAGPPGPCPACGMSGTMRITYPEGKILSGWEAECGDCMTRYYNTEDTSPSGALREWIYGRTGGGS